MSKRAAFFVSDGTGITAEVLGHSILGQFPKVKFETHTIPFVNSPQAASKALETIKAATKGSDSRPIVFGTLVDQSIGHIFQEHGALYFDCLQNFIAPLEQELGIHSSHTMGVSHSARNSNEYNERIEAINYTLAHDDGLRVGDLSTADIVLLGVSRCGKTPTCLYLSLQFGIKAANFPLIPEDLASRRLPDPLVNCKGRLFGLTINPDRLHQIRTERRAGSDYASLANCRNEIKLAEDIMTQENVPFLDTSTKSIEEIATTIVHISNLKRNIY